MTFLIIAAFLLLFFIALIIAYTKLYRTTTPDVAMIITGMGKTKVIHNGGALVIPGFQEMTKVNLKTTRIDILKKDTESLFTRDVHANVNATFFIKVNATPEHIKKAAESLGNRALNDVSELKNLLEGKLQGALRAVAAKLTLQELQENRGEFQKEVKEILASELEKNGMVLEDVSITELSQTDPSKLSQNDMFSAKSRTLTAQSVEQRRKEENDIIRDAELQKAKKDAETEKAKYLVIQEKEKARLLMESELSTMTKDQEVIKATNMAEQERKSREAIINAEASIRIKESEQIKKSKEVEINTEAEIKIAEATKSRESREAEINAEAELKIIQAEKDRQAQEAVITKNVAIANKSKDQSIAETEANKAIQEKVKSEEEIKTTKEVATAERNKKVAVIKAQEEIETSAVEIERMAEARFIEKEKEAEATFIEKEAQAKGIKIMADANERHYEVEAEGKRKINEAENTLDVRVIDFKLKHATISNAKDIIAALVEPIKRIDKISIISMPGLNNQVGSSGEVGINNVFDAALNYKVKSGVMEKALNEVGIDISNPNSFLDKMQPQLTVSAETGDLAPTKKPKSN